MDNRNKNKQKAMDTKRTQQVGSVTRYSDAAFFKKKDEKAKKFLEKHPVPNTFWEK